MFLPLRIAEKIKIDFLISKPFLLLTFRITPVVLFPVLSVIIFATGSGSLILILFMLDSVLVLLISLGLPLLTVGKY
jgi:hypothetical protein